MFFLALLLRRGQPHFVNEWMWFYISLPCFVTLIVQYLSQESVLFVVWDTSFLSWIYNKQATVFCNKTDSTANESQHSDNESNTSADLHYFSSKDCLFSSEKKEDAYTSDEEKCLKKNIRQRLYYQKNLTILNSKKHAFLITRESWLPNNRSAKSWIRKRKHYFEMGKNQMNWVFPIPLAGK